MQFNTISLEYNWTFISKVNKLSATISNLLTISVRDEINIYNDLLSVWDGLLARRKLLCQRAG